MYQPRLLNLGLLLILLLASSARASAEKEFLPPEEAFPLRVETEGPKTLVLEWSIANGYYLYLSKFKFRSLTEDIRLGEPELPAGQIRQDEFFGEVRILRDQAEVWLPLERPSEGASHLSLEVGFQGCADAGFCYPPQRRTLEIDLPVLAAVPKVSPPPAAGPGGKLALARSLGHAGPGEAPDLLPAAEAFRFSAEVLAQDRLGLHWTIAPGTYLYRDKLSLSLEGPAGLGLGDYRLPEGELARNAVRPDGSLGDVVIYREVIDFDLPLLGTGAGTRTVTLVARFQGCADIGVCYPPQKVRVTLPLSQASPDETPLSGPVSSAVTPSAASIATPAATSGPAGGLASSTASDSARGPASSPTTSSATNLATSPSAEPASGPARGPSHAAGGTGSEQDRIAATLAGGNTWAALALFFGFGLLLAMTPCVFPMIPILSGIIAGHGHSLSTRKAFWMSLTYVLAMALTYAIAGLLAGLGGANLQTAFQNPWILTFFALVFVALALSMFGFYDLQLPSGLQSRLAAFSQRQRGGHLIGVAIMGALSALIIGPCVAPPLAGALIFISQTGDALLGFAALFAMGLGMGAPLLIIGTSAGKLLPRAGIWMEAVKAVFGVALLAVAILLLERILPPAFGMLLWGTLLICSGIYMGALHHLPAEASGWRKLWKGLGLAILVYGALMLVGAAAGGKDSLQPLRGLSLCLGASAGEQPQAHFKAIKGRAGLDRELAAARAGGRPVLLDFYADWCVSCKEMERSTFADPLAASEMGRFVLLRADVTANDAEDQVLMQEGFGIHGPPAILFFDAQGRERRDRRLVGFLPAADFVAHLRSLLP